MINNNNVTKAEREEQIVSLWRDGFGDEEEFIRGTLAYIPDELRSVTYSDDGLSVGMGVGVPLSIDLWGSKVKTGFIQSAYVLPAYRGAKFTMNLMSDIFRACENNCLIAAAIAMNKRLVNYYEYGWLACDHSSNCLIECARQEMENVSTENYSIEPMTEGLFDAISFICAGIPNCLLPHPEMFLVQPTDKDYYVAKNKQGDLMGIVGIDKGELPRIFLLESLCEEVRKALLCYVFRQYPVDHVVYTQYSSQPQTGYGYLTRIMDVAAVLSVYAEAHKEVSCAYIVTDPKFEANNHCFVIGDRRCSVAAVPPIDARKVSIFDLTREILPPIYIPILFY